MFEANDPHRDLNDATCINHPERAAVERCEVCHRPLCAYCLYYTSDGQRLCKEHAEEAQAAGAFIRTPGAYAGGLVAAQVGAAREKNKAKPSALYEGNNADVMALIGLIIGVFGLSLCIPGLPCLVGPAGIVVSVLAFAGARDARNPKRTRTMAGIGIGLSALWLVVLFACIWIFFGQMMFVSVNVQDIMVTVNAQRAMTRFAPTNTLAPLPILTPRFTATRAPTSTPSSPQ
jgi:hypothetical protein